MPTWQIFSDTGNDFRWEISERQLAAEEAEDALAQEPSHSDRLPSMADLLLQGIAKIVILRIALFLFIIIIIIFNV